MKEPESFKQLYHWLEVELNIIHVFFYIIMGMIIGGFWWILFVFLILASFRKAFVNIKKGDLKL